MNTRTGWGGGSVAGGSFGQAGIFEQTRAGCGGLPLPPAPPVEVRFETALADARMVQEYELDPTGAAIEFRKHLGWYVKGLPGSAELRKRLHAVTSLTEVEGIFADYLSAASQREEETLAA